MHLTIPALAMGSVCPDGLASVCVFDSDCSQGCACWIQITDMCVASREVHWSGELLHYAWHNKAKVQAMEAQLEDFASSAQKRRSLPSMPKQERHIMHQLAASYGLATQSFGAEPARHVDIFKVGTTSVFAIYHQHPHASIWPEQRCGLH